MAKKYVVKVIEETRKIMIIREVDSYLDESKYDLHGKLFMKTGIGETKTTIIDPYRDLTEMENNILINQVSTN